MIEWIESTWLSEAMNGSPWAFPLAEAAHFFGLCLLIGSIGLIDLRLLGFARSFSVRAVHQLLPLVWIGFGINLFTGVLFIFSSASFYYPNMAFRVKMVLILLAGVNALWYQLTIHKKIADWPETGAAPAQAKVIAGTSLVLWIAIIFFGRFIMYWPPI
jgi:hypothetical protein